jgi:hypothetical protein
MVPEPGPAPIDAGPRARNNTAAYVLLGVGGAGLALGGIFGLMAISKKGDLECPDQQCPPGDETDKLDSARTFATVSTIGFGVGLAGSAVGTILLLSGSSDKTGAARRTRTATRAWVGLGSAGIAGSF